MNTKATAKISPPEGEAVVELTLTMPESLARILKDFSGSISFGEEQDVTELATIVFHKQVMGRIYRALDEAGID